MSSFNWFDFLAPVCVDFVFNILNKMKYQQESEKVDTHNAIKNIKTSNCVTYYLWSFPIQIISATNSLNVDADILGEEVLSITCRNWMKVRKTWDVRTIKPFLYDHFISFVTFFLEMGATDNNKIKHAYVFAYFRLGSNIINILFQ